MQAMLPVDNGGLDGKSIYICNQEISDERVAQLAKAYSLKYPTTFGSIAQRLMNIIIKKIPKIEDIKIEEIDAMISSSNVKLIVIDNISSMCEHFNFTNYHDINLRNRSLYTYV